MGVLPRPGKKLLGKKIEYYVEGQDKTFNAGRMAEYGPIVVKSAQECKKDAAARPFLNNATVAVFPGLPAGFIGGGSAPARSSAAAGAAAAGTAAVGGNEQQRRPTRVVVSGVNTTTTGRGRQTTTTTTQPKAANGPDRRASSPIPTPQRAARPLTVTFGLCKSSDPDGVPLTSLLLRLRRRITQASGLVQHDPHLCRAIPARAAQREGGGQLRGGGQRRHDPSGASGTKTKNVERSTARLSSSARLPRSSSRHPDLHGLLLGDRARGARTPTPSPSARRRSAPHAVPAACRGVETDARCPPCAQGRKSGNTFTATIGFANGARLLASPPWARTTAAAATTTGPSSF